MRFMRRAQSVRALSVRRRGGRCLAAISSTVGPLGLKALDGEIREWRWARTSGLAPSAKGDELVARCGACLDEEGRDLVGHGSNRAAARVRDLGVAQTGDD